MYFWNWNAEERAFKVSDSIRYRPDPYTWQTNDQIGVVEEVSENFYKIKWNDGSTDTLDRMAVEASCELLDRATDFGVPRGCYHDWRDYNGFTKVYQYCSKCDEKRNKT